MLPSLIRYINKQLALNANFPLKKNLCRYLESIATLLLESQHLLEQDAKKFIHTIQKILLFIESIPFCDAAYALGSNHIGTMLCDGDYPVLSTSATRMDIDEHVDKSFCTVLLTIHIALMHYYQDLWFFSYPVDPGKGVVTKEIELWQAELSQLNPALESHAAFCDFRRNYSIAGKCGGTDEELINRIQILIANTAYAESMKRRLFKWFCKNGGQDNNRFVDFLIQAGQFAENEGGTPPFIGSARSVEQDWRCEDGKIYFHYAVYIYSIQLGENTSLIAGLNGKAKCVRSFDEFEAIHKRYKNKMLPPLLFIRAKIRLDCLEESCKHVVPVITQLNVLGFTRLIPSPARFYSAAPKMYLSNVRFFSQELPLVIKAHQEKQNLACIQTKRS